MISKELVQSRDSRTILINNMSKEDQEYLREKYQLTTEMLIYAKDLRERARVEYDQPTQSWIMIYNAVAENFSRPVSPIAIVIRDKNVFVFTRTETQYIQNYFSKIDNTKLHIPLTHQTIWEMVFNALYQITTDFFDQIEELNAQRQELETEIRNSPNNDHIFELADLTKAMVYMLTSANSNTMAIESFKLYNRRLGILDLSQLEYERLDDVLIEARQAQQMAQLTSDITNKVADTYNNLIGNTTNNVMRFLTIYSIVLTIPTIVTGFYGMNVDLPLADSPFSWIFVVVIMVGIIWFMWWQMKRHHFF